MRKATESWRLIDSGPHHPYYNMALDEAIMRAIGEGGVVRFYSWEPPALSLGYFQSASDFDLNELAAGGTIVLRRPTGGGAIYHYRELTFAVIAGPGTQRALGADIESRYARIHGAVINALRQFGVESEMRGGELDPPFSPSAHRMCFNRTIGCDIVAGGRKLVGSAQRKIPNGFLQHGSIPLEQNPMSPSAAWVNDISDSQVSYESLAKALTSAFEETLGTNLLPGDVTAREEVQAQALVRSKYSTGEWNLKR